MNIVILTPVRLLGEGLAACLSSREIYSAVSVVRDLGSLREKLNTQLVQVVLVDVTLGVELFDIRALGSDWPDVTLIALGLTEQRQEVINCGRAGFSGYVSRDASIEALCTALTDITVGRLTCPPEIAGSLLRALRQGALLDDTPQPDHALTRREIEVLRLLGRGLTNKEISSELSLSVATVKHHVHHVLEKLRLTRRVEAMQCVRDAPWLIHRGNSAKLAD